MNNDNNEWQCNNVMRLRRVERQGDTWLTGWQDDSMTGQYGGENKKKHLANILFFILIIMIEKRWDVQSEIIHSYYISLKK